MRAELLNVGWLTSPAGIWREGDPFERKVRFPIPAFLIETADERILVDTGVHPDAVADPGRHYDAPEEFAPFELELEASVAEQLDLGSLTRVVLTHLHFDHAGGLALLPDTVPIVLQRREWEAGHDADAVKRNFLRPKDYTGIGDQVVLVDGDHDLLGDGSVELLFTPGHTAGHQSVKVGDLVIGGDVSHYASGFDDHRFPIFAADHQAQAGSAERLRALRDAGARVLPGHDPALIVPGPLEV